MTAAPLMEPRADSQPSTTRAPDLRTARPYTPEIHRLLPQSPDAEKGALCSYLISPRAVAGLCADRHIAGEHFFIPAHAEIYAALCEMHDGGEPIDFIALTQWLRDRGRLDHCGGAAFITELFTFLPTAANASYYLEILEEKRLARAVIRTCTEYASRGYEEGDDIPGLVDAVERDVLAIRGHIATETLTSAKAATVQAVGAIEEMYERRGKVQGLATGFTDFDRMTDGLHACEMIVIAARPSMGKTALAMNIAEHIAIEERKPVAVFSLEMSTQQLMTRALCSRARVNLSRVRDGFLSERDFPALQSAASKFAEARLWIDDASALTIQEVRARARRLKQQHDIAAIFIDYLQLMRSGTRRGANDRQLEVSEISAGLKALAKELAIPIVVLAQLNRNPEKRTGDTRGRPQLSDLRESGSIEQDADLVALLYREEYYATNDDDREDLKGQATLIIAKQRNGPVGDIPLTFLHEFTRFEPRADTAPH